MRRRVEGARSPPIIDLCRSLPHWRGVVAAMAFLARSCCYDGFLGSSWRRSRRFSRRPAPSGCVLGNGAVAGIGKLIGILEEEQEDCRGPDHVLPLVLGSFLHICRIFL
jgi:hypothetical protein